MTPVIDNDVLVVVGARKWLAEEFAAAALRRDPPLTVIHNWGLDVPALAPYQRPAWWVPTAHAARLLHAGAPIRLTSPGPAWMGWLSGTFPDLTRREITVCRLGDINPTHLGKPAFAKLAEVKTDRVPATWWDTLTQFRDQAFDAGIGVDSWIQYTPVRLEFDAEYRCFVFGSSIPTYSYYFDGAHSYDPDRSDSDVGRGRDGLAFAREVISQLGGHHPPGFSLDVGVTHGQWVVVEANPVWSCAPYGSDMQGVCSATLAGNAWDQDSPWVWTPDPYLLSRARTAAVLVTSVPVRPTAP